jgi:hypothetical protein
LAKPGFERRGTAQAIGDVGEDDREIGDAEVAGESGEARRGNALLDRSGELLAAADEFANNAEDADGWRAWLEWPERSGRCAGGKLGCGSREHT